MANSNLQRTRMTVTIVYQACVGRPRSTCVGGAYRLNIPLHPDLAFTRKMATSLNGKEASTAFIFMTASIATSMYTSCQCWYRWRTGNHSRQP
ncbi:predicted protein [Plenodomus lingam JN3]|uniref:Predicted protein n=1 Tax=Leptosphaeria maculans (strain JN3 / isolate v23.1.3 / race Av1-4-5-6-7-8) TaxID=985895 RepID=E4ZPI5_LEPMJ|nr:predicted protein [Plenodomus lingam JN3]CBX93210.1 predicted protein [Plenodomus lingam JN3]